MCGPLAIPVAMMVTTAVAGAVTYVGQEQAAKNQARYQDASYREGARIAREDFNLKVEAETRRRLEENELKAQQKQNIQVQAAKARATAVTEAGEANVSGLSIENLLADFDNQEAASIASLDRSGTFRDRQFTLNVASHRATADNYLTNLRGRPVTRPNLFASVLSTAGAVGNTYAGTRGLT